MLLLASARRRPRIIPFLAEARHADSRVRRGGRTLPSGRGSRAGLCYVGGDAAATAARRRGIDLGGRSMRAPTLLALSALVAALVSPTPAHAHGNVSCTMRFELSGWSVIYKTSHGTGRVTCRDGESMAVHIRTYGGGLTVGKSRIHGRGDFSGVRGIDDVLGTYVQLEAHAGAVKSSDATVMTNGPVSLALAATGDGWDLGLALGGFVIER
jgi:hypothetical protein